MKLNGSVLVVVAMMVGSLSAMGCKSKDTSADQGSDTAATPDESPATAPVSTETANAGSPGTEQDARIIGVYAPHAPPALRVETRGPGPGAGHFWAPGYYGWNGREHIWHGGAWYPNRAGYEYIGPRWENRGGRWGYLGGRWHRH